MKEQFETHHLLDLKTIYAILLSISNEKSIDNGCPLHV
jgi:hypothetical protein